MNDIQIIKQNSKKVLDALKIGEIERIEFAVEQITDEFMIYGIRGGLIDDAGIITSIAFGAIQVHDLTLCNEL